MTVMPSNTNQQPPQYLVAPQTVAQPVEVQSPALVSGTVGYTGAIQYSTSSAAIVNETYVVTVKK